MMSSSYNLYFSNTMSFRARARIIGTSCRFSCVFSSPLKSDLKYSTLVLSKTVW